jgi:flagellar biosynthesis protein
VSDPAPDPRRPRPVAVAVRYAREEAPAPRVTAAGSGPVAERILELARAEGIPLREDPDLVAALAALDLGAMIPTELYEVIAEVLAWAYRANASFTSATRGLTPS